MSSFMIKCEFDLCAYFAYWLGGLVGAVAFPWSPIDLNQGAVDPMQFGVTGVNWQCAGWKVGPLTRVKRVILGR